MTPFGKRVWEINGKYMPKDFEEIKKATKIAIAKKKTAQGLDFVMPVAKKGKFRRLR